MNIFFEIIFKCMLSNIIKSFFLNLINTYLKILLKYSSFKYHTNFFLEISLIVLFENMIKITDFKILLKQINIKM